MTYKLAFRFNRSTYVEGIMEKYNPQITRRLATLLDHKIITYSHIYEPSRNSIKVVFPNENEIDKVFKNIEIFTNENFEPRLSLELKASRTVFCSKLDPAILATYSKEDIKASLQQQRWKIKEIYITKSKKSFKIEFINKKQAIAFIQDNNTHIGNIRLSEDSKEPEVDPTIKQCWECGQLEPNHNTQNCLGKKICLKCGDPTHKFYACPIPSPKDTRLLSEAHKSARYCAACRKKTDHTTLDHRNCPIKREKIRERARIAREKRAEGKENQDRDTELIRQTINMANKDEWPELKTNTQQHAKIVTLITLALVEEAIKPGIFNKKLEEGYKNNGLPVIKYNLEPQTATKFLEKITRNTSHEITPINKNTQETSSLKSTKPTTGAIGQFKLQKKGTPINIQDGAKASTSILRSAEDRSPDYANFDESIRISSDSTSDKYVKFDKSISISPDSTIDDHHQIQTLVEESIKAQNQQTYKNLLNTTIDEQKPQSEPEEDTQTLEQAIKAQKQQSFKNRLSDYSKFDESISFSSDTDIDEHDHTKH